MTYASYNHSLLFSHSGNLLCGTIVKTDKEFERKVAKLLTEFKTPDLEYLLLQKHGNRMVLPGDTRWCSTRDAYRRCLRNLGNMREIVQEGAIIKEENRTLLFDENFEATLIDHLVILDPVCKVIRQCEKKKTNIADATELWLGLELPAVNEQFDQMVQERLQKVINRYGLAANFLHHNYRGLRFQNNDNYMQMVDTFYRENLTDDGLRALEHYMNGTGYFGILHRKNYRSWLVFWKAAAYFYPELSRLALKLLNICAATAELERLFSQWSYVHDTKRNRLLTHRSKKLASLYYTFRAKDENQCESSSDSEDE